MFQKRLLSLLLLVGLYQTITAQNIDLFSEKSSLSGRDITTGIFKSTRIVNGQSIENVGAGVLDFRILHRFGAINQGGYNLFGLDQATMRLGLDYGINSKLMVGVGRSTFEKQYDAFVKYRLLRQQTGERNIPLSVSYAGTAIYKSLKDVVTTYEPYKTDKLSFAHQILVASKVNDYFSIQLTPTVVHYNMVEHQGMPNDFYSLGTGFRLRLSPRVNLTSEYYYRFDKLTGYYNPMTLGLDIETGGHVFQLHVTNSTGMTERTFINETTGSWGKGDLRFGFNISRVFTVRKPKELRGF
ncbi:MAG: hypothetical protein RL387_1384 [Bacteroidota bacterium]|jgi:hypothetical protein